MDAHTAGWGVSQYGNCLGSGIGIRYGSSLRLRTRMRTHKRHNYDLGTDLVHNVYSSDSLCVATWLHGPAMFVQQ